MFSDAFTMLTSVCSVTGKVVIGCHIGNTSSWDAYIQRQLNRDCLNLANRLSSR